MSRANIHNGRRNMNKADLIDMIISDKDKSKINVHDDDLLWKLFILCCENYLFYVVRIIYFMLWELFILCCENHLFYIVRIIYFMLWELFYCMLWELLIKSLSSLLLITPSSSLLLLITSSSSLSPSSLLLTCAEIIF